MQQGGRVMWLPDPPLYPPPPFSGGSGDVFGFIIACLIMAVALGAALFWALFGLGLGLNRMSKNASSTALLLAFLGAPLGTAAIFYEYWTPWIHDIDVSAGNVISVVVFSLAGIVILIAIGAAFVIPFMRDENRSGRDDDLGCTFVVLLAIATGAIDMFTGFGFWLSLLAGIVTAIAYLVAASFVADNIRRLRRRY